MYYNSKTNELQSNPPWGNSWLHPDIIAQNYPDWTQVADSFVPPIPELTIEQKIDILNAEYNPQFDALKDALMAALAKNDTTTIDDIRTDYATLQTEYNTKMEAIV